MGALKHPDYFVSGVVCIILAVTNAGYVETNIIGVHNSTSPASIHYTLYTKLCNTVSSIKDYKQRYSIQLVLDIYTVC